MGTPRGRWPRARGKGKQGARWRVGGRTATERNSFSAWGGCKSALPGSSSAHSANLRVGGAAALRSPRALARASDKAPLTRAPLCVCIFFSLPLAPGTGRRPPPPPSPALRLPSPGGLPFPGCAPGPRDAFSAPCAGEPSPSHPSRLGAALGVAGARGAGGPEPSTPEVPGAPIQSLEGGAGARCERGAGSLRGEMERTGAASIWGESERGGEERQRGRGERRERERCSDRDCHWGQRSTAPGSWAAPAPLSVSSPPGPRALHAPAVVPAHSNPPPAP